MAKRIAAEQEKIIASPEDLEPRIIKMKCKPTYNFQSIEFEYDLDLNNPDTLTAMFDLYDTLVLGLQQVAPEQPMNAKPVVIKGMAKPKGEAATEKQLAIMNDFGISFRKGITKQEARQLIQKSIDKAKKLKEKAEALDDEEDE